MFTYFVLFVTYPLLVQVKCVGVCVCNVRISGLKLLYFYCMSLLT